MPQVCPSGSAWNADLVLDVDLDVVLDLDLVLDLVLDQTYVVGTATSSLASGAGKSNTLTASLLTSGDRCAYRIVMSMVA